MQRDWFKRHNVPIRIAPWDYGETKPKPSPRVAVVIATYNEAGTIAELLHNLRHYRVFVVDDSSPDGTAEIASKFEHVSVITRPFKLGVASAYCAGFFAVLDGAEQWDAIVQMDAGGTHDPLDIPMMLPLCFAGHALVIGSRFKSGVVFKGRRAVLSQAAALAMRALGCKVCDATSGFRIWKPEALQIAAGQVISSGFAFQLETLHATVKAGYSVAEYPIPYTLGDGGSTISGKMIREAIRAWARLAGRNYS